MPTQTASTHIITVTKKSPQLTGILDRILLPMPRHPRIDAPALDCPRRAGSGALCGVDEEKYIALNSCE